MRRAALTILAGGLLAAGCGSGDESSGEAGATGTGGGETGKTITIELAAQNDSGESGTATLAADGPKTKVVLELENPPGDAPQPAHIHKGTCAELDPAPAYALANVVGGASETTVDVPLEELEGGRFAINVHKSESEADVYVACGQVGNTAGKQDDDSGSGGYGY